MAVVVFGSEVSRCLCVVRQVYSSLDLSRGLLEEKGEAEGKKSESPLTVDSLSWTPDFAEMYASNSGPLNPNT